MKAIGTILIFCFCITLKGQENIPEAIERLIEEIAENYEEADYSLIAENLLNVIENPVHINDCSYEDLARIFFLTDFQIRSLLEYIKKNGALVSPHEIQYIYGFDLKTADWILPFITFDPEKKVVENKINLFKTGKHDLMMYSKKTLRPQAGYVRNDTSASGNSIYAGDPYKLRIKYTFAGNHIRYGLQAEKDAGEEFFKGKQGFDFYGGYILFEGKGILKQVIAGDYHLQFGQGLTLWSGFSAGKSFASVSRYPQGIRRNLSADENNFFRGFASTVQINPFELTTFVSYKKIDANRTDSLREFTSFLNTGNHRTPAEMNDEKSVNELVTGFNISFLKDWFRAGISMVNYSFNADYNPADQLYNRFSFRGSSLTDIGMDYRLRLNRAFFFGEATYGNKSRAVLQGMELSCHARVNLSFVYRNYSKSFFALRSSPFSEYSSNNNEEGLYIGTSVVLHKWFKLFFYSDVFKSPWLRYHVNSPSHGQEYFVQIDFTPKGRFSAYARFKREMKSTNFSEQDVVIPYPAEYSTDRIRLNTELIMTQQLYLRNRTEWAVYHQENRKNEHGFLIQSNVILKHQKLPFSLWTGFCFFTTGSWDTRIYAFENSIPSVFSVPVFSDKGIRGYSLLRYSFKKRLDVWIKYGHSYYFDKKVIGTGPEKIEGHSEPEMEMMIKMNF